MQVTYEDVIDKMMGVTQTKIRQLEDIKATQLEIHDDFLQTLNELRRSKQRHAGYIQKLQEDINFIEQQQGQTQKYIKAAQQEWESVAANITKVAQYSKGERVEVSKNLDVLERSISVAQKQYSAFNKRAHQEYFIKQTEIAQFSRQIDLLDKEFEMISEKMRKKNLREETRMSNFDDVSKEISGYVEDYSPYAKHFVS